MGTVLSMIGSVLVLGWGVAHLFPTRGVADGFGEISVDNRRILVMEWIVEGVALIFAGVLGGYVTLAWGPSDPHAARIVWAVAGFLVVMAAVSLFTGFRVAFLPFRLCPILFTASAVLLVAGTLVA